MSRRCRWPKLTVATAVQHDLDKPAQLRSQVLFRHREAPIAIFNGVDEPIGSRSGGRNLLPADAHQQMPDLRPFRIGVEIQLPDLGGAGKASGAAYGDGRGLVASRPAGADGGSRTSWLGEASAWLCGRRDQHPPASKPTSTHAALTFSATDGSFVKRRRAELTVACANDSKLACALSWPLTSVSYQTWPAFSQLCPPMSSAAKAKARLGIPELMCTPPLSVSVYDIVGHRAHLQIPANLRVVVRRSRFPHRAQRLWR